MNSANPLHLVSIPLTAIKGRFSGLKDNDIVLFNEVAESIELVVCKR